MTNSTGGQLALRYPGQGVGQSVVGLIVAVVVGRAGDRVADRSTRGGVLGDFTRLGLEDRETRLAGDKPAVSVTRHIGDCGRARIEGDYLSSDAAFAIRNDKDSGVCSA